MTLTQRLRPLHPLPLSILLAFGLTACDGGVSTPASTTSATLEDGLVVNATVFCDANQNGLLDSGEASTTTNSLGVFTFTSACNADIVSVAGTGIDTDTGTAPSGSLRAKAGAKVVSPFTTLVAEGNLTELQAKAVMAAMGLGSVDPGTTSLSGLSDTSRKKARAAIKVMNDLTTVLVSTGSHADAKTAFKAVAGTLATSVKVSSAGNPTFDLFAGDNLGKALKAAIPAGFDRGVRDLVVGTLNASARSIADASDDDAARRLFASTGATEFIEKHRDKPSEVTNYPGADDLLAAAPRLEFTSIVMTASGSAAQTLTAAAVSAGTAKTSFKLGDLDVVTIPLKAVNVRKLPASVAVAVELSETGGTRKLQFGIDTVQLSKASNDMVSVTLPAGARMSFYARTASGVTLEPANSIENLTANAYDGLAIPIGLIKAKLQAAMGNATGVSEALALTGKFDIKVTVSHSEIRPTSGTALPVSTIRVGAARPRAFPGYTYGGAITFGATLP
ncbi:hypothetical protein ACWA7J_12750 [Leptothrix sp. BB-4]